MEPNTPNNDLIAKAKIDTLDIVSPQENDSLGSTAWREYLNSGSLGDVWSVPEGSPYARFQKSSTIDSIDKCDSVIKPRYSKGEQTSEKGIDTLIATGVLDSHTAIVLDSGHAHSVAMAVKLAEQGYQPVVMLNDEVTSNRSNSAEQGLATLLYFAEQVKILKAQGKIKSDSPPVFILDFHRSSSFVPQDFPTGEELSQAGIDKVVYLNEGDQSGEINANYQSTDRLSRDLKSIASNWESEGLNITYTGVSPWVGERNAFFSQGLVRGLSRRLNMGGAYVSDGYAFESGLSYSNMDPEVYGKKDALGIAMHHNRERFIFTREGKLEVINESGVARAMQPEEIEQFQEAIRKALELHPDNLQMMDVSNRLSQAIQPISLENKDK
ncbi:MAG TPA: hypothetical protein VMR77_04290 [Patescibacteria group bacterium]|nr:hypothetical protein [Patescibacteria group bacterium]